MYCEDIEKNKQRKEAYIDKFFIKIVCVIAVLHEEDKFLLVLSIFVQLNDIVMVKTRVNNTFLPSEVYTELIHQLGFIDLFLNYLLYDRGELELSLSIAYFVGFLVCSKCYYSWGKFYLVELLYIVILLDNTKVLWVKLNVVNFYF